MTLVPPYIDDPTVSTRQTSRYENTIRMNDFRIEFEPQVTFNSAAGLLLGLIVIWGIVRRCGGAPLGVSRRIGLVSLRIGTTILLCSLLLNPVKISESSGGKNRPEVFYLLDSSQSMSVGDGESRWNQSLQMIRDSLQNGNELLANISLFRFGQRLAAVEPSMWQQAAGEFLPTDSDTQLAAALRQLTSRFGRTPPGAVVVFSDGRARDAGDLESLALHFSKIKVPVHVVPIGVAGKGGDLAIVGAVSPQKVRKNSQIEVRVFLRSYGFEESRCNLVVSAVDRSGVRRKLNSLPITVRSGIQSFVTNYQSGEVGQKIEVSVTTLPGEMSVENNRYQFNMQVDRTKVRVLYVEGSPQPSLSFNAVGGGAQRQSRGPHTHLQNALTADPDIECVALVAVPGTRRLQRISENPGADVNRGFPESVAELAAFDAIIISNTSRRSFTDEQLEWIEQWIEKRGGGLCMLGGPNGFAAGGWKEEIIGRMLPIEMNEAATEWLPSKVVKLFPTTGTSSHPIWHFVENENLNREILKKIPEFTGFHQGHQVKSDAHATLMSTTGDSDQGASLLTIGAYGKGRTMAFSVPATPPWAREFIENWGEGDHRYFAKFWRNVVYWLTEDSSIGRRRLVAKSDQAFYRPTEKVTITAGAYDESSNRTSAYRLVAMIEPQGPQSESDSVWSPFRWPEGIPRTSGETGPYIAWGEEFDFPRGTEELDYAMKLELGPAPAAAAATQSMRLELTAYENSTQVDSTSLDLRVVHDPYELQNPFPEHEQLFKIANLSRGEILPDVNSIREMLKRLPVPPQSTIVRKSPWWSQPWIFGTLMILLTIEWFWRRRLGLA